MPINAVLLARHNDGVPFDVESLTLGGVRLVGPLALEVGESVQVLIEVEEHLLDVEGEVVHVIRQDALRDCVAVTFTSLSLADRETLLRVVEEP